MIHDLLVSNTTFWLQKRCPVLIEAFDWLRTMPVDPPDGITELRGRDMYVNVHGYATLPADQCRWEAHRHTADLQYCVSGGEIIEWSPEVDLEPAGEYDSAKDTQKWRDSVAPRVQLRMVPGAYVIFFPNELHRPKVADGVNAAVRKIVVKIQKGLLEL